MQLLTDAVLFQTLCFSRMLYKRKQCCTHFKTLLLLPQPYLPLPILMKALMYLTECYLRSNWSSQLWAPFLIATVFRAIVKPFWPDYVTPISHALSCPKDWLMETLRFGAQFPCRRQWLHTGRQRCVWPFIMNLGYFLFFSFNFHFSVWDGVCSQMLFIFRTSSCCDHLTLNETSVAARAFYTLNVNFSVG